MQDRTSCRRPPRSWPSTHRLASRAMCPPAFRELGPHGCVSWKGAPSSPLCVLCKVRGDVGEGGARAPSLAPRFLPHQSSPRHSANGNAMGEIGERRAWRRWPPAELCSKPGPESVLSLHPWVLWPLLLRKNGVKLAVRARSCSSWSLCSDKSLFFPGPQFP